MNEELFVDLRLLDPEERVGDKIHPLTWLFDICRTHSVKAIPATSCRRDLAYQSAVAAAVATDRRGVAVRLEDEDAFSEDLEKRLADLLKTLSLKPQDVDLIIDLGVMIPSEERRVAAAIKGLLLTLPSVKEWRTLTCAGTAIPKNMGELPHGIHPIPRSEWRVWRLLADAKAAIPRLPTFGDYAIAHPTLSDVDPRIMTISANVRYTTESDWLIFRGMSVGKHGSSQYAEFCKTLLTRPEYGGANFSAGDGYIARCASGAVGHGNSTTWRRVATNHHITFVSRQLANVTAASS